MTWYILGAVLLLNGQIQTDIGFVPTEVHDTHLGCEQSRLTNVPSIIPHPTDPAAAMAFICIPDEGPYPSDIPVFLSAEAKEQTYVR